MFFLVFIYTPPTVSQDYNVLHLVNILKVIVHFDNGYYQCSWDTSSTGSPKVSIFAH